MTEQHTDPGPVPAVVEPAAPVEATMVISAAMGWQAGVTPNWRQTGEVGLTLRTPDVEVTIPLAPFHIDELCRLLAEACPLETVRGWST